MGFVSRETTALVVVTGALVCRAVVALGAAVVALGAAVCRGVGGCVCTAAGAGAPLPAALVSAGARSVWMVVSAVVVVLSVVVTVVSAEVSEPTAGTASVVSCGRFPSGGAPFGICRTAVSLIAICSSRFRVWL